MPGYTLNDRLGRGGSGEVWRARRAGAAPPVAVKVLVDGDPARQAREAALLGELDHPHLVRLIEVVHQPPRRPARGRARARPARGRQPRRAARPPGPAPSRRGGHRDRSGRGRARPCARQRRRPRRPVPGQHRLHRGRPAGAHRPRVWPGWSGETAPREVTPAYVDPTVARGAAPGPASDVFGVAAAAFHALTGDRPLERRDPGDTLRVAADGHCPTWPSSRPDAPPALLAVVGRGLAPDPHDRGTAAAFALDLRHACRPEPVRLPADGVPDAELGVTGRGPRTELTHQVPGRRPRPAPAVSAPAGRAALASRSRPGRSRRPGRARASVPVVLAVASRAGGRCRIAGFRRAGRAGRRARPRSAASAGRAARPPVVDHRPRPRVARRTGGRGRRLYRRGRPPSPSRDAPCAGRRLRPRQPAAGGRRGRVRALARAGECCVGSPRGRAGDRRSARRRPRPSSAGRPAGRPTTSSPAGQAAGRAAAPGPARPATAVRMVLRRGRRRLADRRAPNGWPDPSRSACARAARRAVARSVWVNR